VWSVPQKQEPIIEVLVYRARIQDGAARGRKLNGQRQAIEPAAHGFDRVRVRFRDDKCGLCGSGPLKEQPRGVCQRQTLNDVDVLTSQVERLAAGDEHDQAGAVLEQKIDVESGIEHLFEVVEHEQHATTLETFDEQISRRRLCCLADVQRTRNCWDHQLVVPHL
jgi:hypothetical protein